MRSFIKKRKVLILAIVLSSIAAFWTYKNIKILRKDLNPSIFGLTATDWPQVQKDSQHSGFSTETLGTNYVVKWSYPFQPEKIHPQVQAIIYTDTVGKKVFVGTEMGNLYAIDAVNPDSAKPGFGKVLWKFNSGSPILNSVAADSGKVFFAALDGNVYAVNAESGTLAWKKHLSRKGFSVAPVINDNKIMLGSRDGKFYALDLDGNLLWEYNVNSPILQTAASNGGKVYFGTLDMFVYAINTATGTLAWKSAQLYGGGFTDYWPVVHQNKLIIRPMAREAWREYRSFPNIKFPFVTSWGSTDPMWSWLQTYNNQLVSGNASQISDFMNAQTTAFSNYNTNPNSYIKNLYVLDEATGHETLNVPHWANNTMNGTTFPPCVDRDNKLITPILFVRSAWGRLDLLFGGTGNTPRIVDILYDGLDNNNQQVPTSKQGPKGTGNPDENMALSCSQNQILTFHIQEGNAHFTGYFNLDTRKWTKVSPGYKNKQLWTNTQGGGANSATISNGMVYHISGYELIARTTN